MIKLSDRLQVIADEVNIGESVADIGTDHGFLPLSLYEREISPKVIMADISPGSLSKAEENCKSLFPDIAFDLRLGNGLSVLAPSEVDDVVIAGMGGLLMIRIFKEDMDRTLSFRKFILQPRISSGKLRHFLLHNGMSITGDTLVREGRFICNVITAVTEKGCSLAEIEDSMEEILSLAEDDIRLDIPSWQKSHPLFRELVERRLRQEEEIFQSMEDSTTRWNDKKKHTLESIAYLRGYLK